MSVMNSTEPQSEILLKATRQNFNGYGWYGLGMNVSSSYLVTVIVLYVTE